MDKDVKNTILNMAETQLDEVLQMNGFKRRSNSLIYARKSKESTQKIEIMYFLHPSYYNPIFDSWKDKNGYKPSKHGLCSRFLFRNDMCYIMIFLI